MYGPDWPVFRSIAWVRDLGRCIVCGHRVEEGHHRVIQGKGGRAYDEDRHRPDGVLSFCRKHHEQVHLHRDLSRDLGYILEPGSVATEVAVWYPTEFSWMMLTEGGTRLAYPNWRAPELQIV